MNADGEKKYILAIDQSTSNTKAVLFSQSGKLVDRVDVPHRQIVVGSLVEHDAEEIYQNTLLAVKRLIDKDGERRTQIKACGITNQRETAICFDIKSGKPVYNAIVWQDGRATEQTDRVETERSYVKKVTGLNLSPYFSAPKYAWIIENIKEAQECAKKGDIRCCNVDAWLVFKLTGNFKTDVTNASRTLILDLETLSYDEKMLSLFGLKREFLPKIACSDELFGYTDFEGLLPEKVPIKGVMGDSHAALFANTEKVGGIKATFGTGTSLMLNVGDKRISNCPTSVVESVAYSKNGKAYYAIEGNINYSGAVMNKVIDLGLAQSVREIATAATSVEDSGGVYLVPAFSGLSAPYWDENARAVICGMSASTKKEHILRAAEEAVAYQIKDVFEEIKRCDIAINGIYADGGATRDDFLMGFVSDILDVTVSVSSVEELSAFGVAAIAAASEEFYGGKTYKTVQPKMSEEKRQTLYGGWKDAVAKAITNK